MKANWLIAGLITMFTACSGMSTPISAPSPGPAFTATPIILMDTPEFYTATLVAKQEPQPAMQASIGQNPVSAIIVRMHPGPFYLLGGTNNNNEWLHAETVVSDLVDGEAYQIYAVDGHTGTTKGKKPVFEQHCGAYRVETDLYPMGGRTVGVTERWDVIPRFATVIPNDQVTYVEALKTWLVGQNIPEPVVALTQILRTDIEGDGIEEVLINASHFAEPTGHSVGFGDYSVVIMRKVVGNSVVTIPIVADYYYQHVEIQFPLTYSGVFIADLNGDSILEILVAVERWEGSGVIVYEVDKTNVSKLFEVICGL